MNFRNKNLTIGSQIIQPFSSLYFSYCTLHRWPATWCTLCTCDPPRVRRKVRSRAVSMVLNRTPCGRGMWPRPDKTQWQPRCWRPLFNGKNSRFVQMIILRVWYWFARHLFPAMYNAPNKFWQPYLIFGDEDVFLWIFVFLKNLVWPNFWRTKFANWCPI